MIRIEGGGGAWRAAVAPTWRQWKARGGRGGGPAWWAGCFGPAQCEQSYFLFIQTILNCPGFE
jgi:hypothetical protein